MGYHISKCWNIEKIGVWKFNTAKIYALGRLKVQTHFFQYKRAEIKVKKYGTTDYKTLRLSNIKTF